MVVKSFDLKRMKEIQIHGVRGGSVAVKGHDTWVENRRQQIKIVWFG
jgi:hypothetical protein